jgi:hypothetical protein
MGYKNKKMKLKKANLTETAAYHNLKILAFAS